MSRFCAVVLMVAFIMNLLTVVHGRCFAEALTIIYKGSKQIKKCVHDSLVYLVGTKFKTTDCWECSCTDSGFTCCGFGINADYIDVPSGYKPVQYGCNYKFVKDDDYEIEN